MSHEQGMSPRGGGRQDNRSLDLEVTALLPSVHLQW